MEKYDVGYELIPYAGGGDYGYCFSCKKPGMIVIEVPQYKPRQPEGWTKVPQQ
jgi:hypothetical protein